MGVGGSGSSRRRMMETLRGEVGRDGGPTIVGGGRNQININTSVPVSLMICILKNGYLDN